MENTKELRDMLIRFYNLQAGTHFWTTVDRNQELVSAAIDRCNGDVAVIKAHVKDFIASHNEVNDQKVFAECWMTAKAPVAPEVQKVEPEVVTDTQVQNGLGILEQAMVQILAGMNASKIEEAVVGKAEQKIRDFIASEYGSIERKITTIIDGNPVQLEGVQHEKFATVLKFVANNEPVYLTGAAGTGKNELCKQVAKALGLDFYFTNAVTQEYKLTGFTDANGHYQATQFYRAFTEGGLFMLDEMDASIPEVLVILNAAIANRYFDFPAPIGYKEAHPNFRVVAAGNTLGHGASFEYNGRNQLDGASLDRFAMVQIDYSPAIEEAMAGGNAELLQFCRAYRKAANEQGLNIIVSYRAIKRLAKMVQLLDVEEALETCLIRGLEKDDIKMIAEKLPSSQYKSAMLRLTA